MDVMAKRYGWTFEYILTMPFLSFTEALDIINTAIQEEFKDNMTLNTFGAWQIIESLKMMLGGESKNNISFQEYCKKLGLLDPSPEINKQSLKMEKQKALANANEILEIYKKGAKKEQ
jgi:hypothetical protein